MVELRQRHETDKGAWLPWAGGFSIFSLSYLAFIAIPICADYAIAETHQPWEVASEIGATTLANQVLFHTVLKGHRSAGQRGDTGIHATLSPSKSRAQSPAKANFRRLQ